MKAKLMMCMLCIGLMMAACGGNKPQEQAQAIDTVAVETLAVDSLTQQLDENASSIQSEADSVNTEVDKLLEDI